MTEQEQNEMKRIIEEKIDDTKHEIASLKELTKPVESDSACRRLTRMDAINNKTINDKALREQKSRLQKLERV